LHRENAAPAINSSSLKDQEFLTFPRPTPAIWATAGKGLCSFRRVRLRRVAAAPTKNIENNPMQSSRRAPQSTVWTEYLTRRANQQHNFTIAKSAQRPRARNGCCPVSRRANSLTCDRMLHRGSFNSLMRSYSAWVHR
jgi:hypothetical protein